MTDVGTGPNPPSPPPPAAAPTERPLAFGERLSDRLNPILVREVQQALYGRAFFGLLTISAIAVIVLGFSFVALQENADAGGAGRLAFTVTLACLVPVATLLIPSQSFHSMRHEVQGSVSEQLALTRLRPRGVVLGKVLAGLVQLLLILAMFAPLLALTFLLRGIDVPTIAVSVVLLLLLGFAMCAFAVGAAAVGGGRTGRQLVQGLSFAAMVITTFSAVSMAMELPRLLARVLDDESARITLGSALFGLATGSVLSITVGVTSLAHGYENRSAPFRIFGLATSVLAFALLAVVVDRADLDRAAPDTASWLALFLAPIWGWAASEDPRLSPRVRAHVPASRLRAVLAAPFLPGAPRGVLFVLLLTAVMLSCSSLLWAFGSSGVFGYRHARIAVAAWSYVVFLASLGAWFRRLHPSGAPGSKRTFAFLLILVAFGSLVPWGAQLLLHQEFDGRWNLLHLLNPIFTANSADTRSAAFNAAVGLGILGLVLAIVPVRDGLRAVLDASRARRERAAQRVAEEAGGAS